MSKNYQYNTIKPKKKFGQHFLTDTYIVDKIIEQIDALTQKTGVYNLVEIGPGTGALTEQLVQMPNISLKVIEIDREAIVLLKEKYPSLDIIEGSVLHQDLRDVFGNEDCLIVGNFPYNISSQILFKVLEYRENIRGMIGMFQKEVAQRVCASHGNKTYGIISILIQVFFEPTYLFDVPAQAFVPPPKIQSGVIQLDTKQVCINEREYKRLKSFVKTVFNQRRKKLSNSLRSYDIDLQTIAQHLDKRPEQLSVEEYLEILKEIHP